uniref:Uncharacterized protein n=1 Tax=Cereibacter sphaeroides (strain ATCC 17025 / ATH 2.4.3) TaxID=349102 RepID=A4WS10_CERS5
MLSRHRNWSLSTVAIYASNDGKFFKRVAEGGGCTLRTAQRVVGWFSENWPDDLEWPAHIARPNGAAAPPRPGRGSASRHGRRDNSRKQ